MPLLIINGKIVNPDQQLLTDFHGHSVFTTLRSQNGQPQYWPEHWQRITTHAHFFSYKIPKEDAIYHLIEEQLANTKADQKMRIILANHNYALTFEPYEPPSPDIYQGVSTIISTFHVHPQLAEFKTGNSLPYTLAHKEAERLGAFEALLLNHDGFVVDGSRTSLMLFNDHTLTILEGGLKGVMREQAIDYADSHGVNIKRDFLKPQALRGQLLLANSLMGVVPVSKVECDFVHEMVNYFRMDKIL